MVARNRTDTARVLSADHTAPTDAERERIRANAEPIVRCLRDGFNRSVLDAHLAHLNGASIQRLYVRFVLRAVVRWLADTLTRDELVAYAHHVPAQDGAPPPSAVGAKMRVVPDTAVAAVLRALVRLTSEG